MSKLTLCLWFDGQAEAAAAFYVAAFRAGGREAAVGEVLHQGEVGRAPPGAVLVVPFTLDGQKVIGLNGGPHFHFTPALSVVVECAEAAEVDHFWAALSEGGTPGQCGWLTDRFGVSWQVVPTALIAMLRDPDPARVARVTQAMLGMTKLDLGALRRAYDGGP